ncbi:hypothetical protein PWG15_23660 (plasmid) [Ensifer adhaerens]|uniref:hypothetical protein n=1 Tax=Ensifer adhaerens TaxID=106592 RepID=UPI0023A9D12E|nr:hypothetical protein [Ensifer adhaerens]WDZ80761.1 hypothetical protein PWG15_23660 [Ensifer adhaerens]
MRAFVLTIIRLGPCGAYMVAAIALLSVALLCNAPSSSFAWALYTTMLPMTRTLILTLVNASDVVFWGVTLTLLVAAAIGGYLAVRPERYLQLRFIHAHAALVASGLAVLQISQSSAGFASSSFAQLPPVGWPVVDGSSAAFALFVLIFLACLSAHVAIIKSVRSARHRTK